MNELLLGLLSAMLATNQVVAASNVLARTTGIHAPVVDPNDPVEREYQQLLTRDDEAQEEVDEWIKKSRPLGPATSSSEEMANLTLDLRIKQRFETVENGYQDFLRRHPEHTKARLAYGSYLSDLGRHDEAVVQWERARELDPKNPATWNNLADHFSHFGPADKCIKYFAKAVELAPDESVYQYNLATAVFVFRPDAREIYSLPDDQAVFRKSIELYRKVRTLAPSNFKYATDLAQVYYYVMPPAQPDKAAYEAARQKVWAEGTAAWLDARKLTVDDDERQGVDIHLARLSGIFGRYAEARSYLEKVTSPALQDIKERILRSLDLKEKAGLAEPEGLKPSP